MNTWAIDDLLRQMALEGRRRFSPRYICGRLKINNDEEVANYLLGLAESKVIPMFEVECPNGDSDFFVDHPNKILYEPRYCSICGIEYIPDPDQIWLVFNFTNKYVEYEKKNVELNKLTVTKKTNKQQVISMV